MAALNFPASPTNGQTYVASGVTYTFDSAKGYWFVTNYSTAPKGDAASIAVGTTSTLAPGSSATVSNVGDSFDAIFNFGIPKGDTGAPIDSGVLIGLLRDVDSNGSQINADTLNGQQETFYLDYNNFTNTPNVLDSAQISAFTFNNAGEIEVAVNHDNLVGFVANEHINHTSISITAGKGLGGGGTIDASRTLHIDSAEFLAQYEKIIRHDNLSGFVADEHVAHTGVTLTAGKGLAGGGTIAASRTFHIDSAEFLAQYEKIIRHDNLVGFVANEHVDHSSITLTAGKGLAGGGTITASRTFSIDSAEFLAQYEKIIRHDNLSGFVANEHLDWTNDQGTTNINAANITQGSVTQHQSALSITQSQISDLTVSDSAYGITWNGSLDVATKNAIYDKIETLGAGGGANVSISIDPPISPAEGDLWWSPISGLLLIRYIDSDATAQWVSAIPGNTGVADSSVTSTKLASSVQLIIYDSIGTPVKTLYGSGI